MLVVVGGRAVSVEVSVVRFLPCLISFGYAFGVFSAGMDRCSTRGFIAYKTNL